MPQFPYVSQVDARTGRTNLPEASAASFGAGIGQATQQLGETVGDTGALLAAAEKKKREAEAAAALAKFDNTRNELELRNSMGPNAEGYQQAVVDQYTEAVDRHVEALEDNNTRKEVRERLMSQLPSVSSRSAQYEIELQAKRSVQLGNEGLAALSNKISQTPDNFDQFLEEGQLVIDAMPGITGYERENMYRQWKYDSARRRFDGKINAATTPQDFDAIAREMANVDGKGRDWQSEMLPADYEQVMNTLGNAKKIKTSQATAEAKAVISTLNERMKDTTTLVPTDQLQQAQEAVAAAGDPELQREMAMIMRHQDQIRTKNKLPPSELRAQINATNGNPGVSYPGLPPRVSDGINRAAEITGESVGFLGGLVSREYGSELKQKRPRYKEEFRPQTAHSAIDTRNIRTDILDAVTYAGEIVGAPLAITKGAGSAGMSGVDISTVGMAPQDKAKLVAALVDGGFTGFGEYDGYIRAEMRDEVPETFGVEKDGKVWGGWTNLSPEIVTTLKERGFGAGAKSDIIKRNNAAVAEGIDYGKPTQIVDENGKPTSTAVGVMQFTEGTWLETIKDPATAAALNLDISQMSDDDLLAMRADPDVSIVAGAIYASKNRKIVENALGRRINDAELYMAHFLGVGGATTFLTAYKNSPTSPAAQMMQAAAKANPGVFYRNPKGSKTDPANQKTFEEIYGSVSRSFALSPSQIAFEDNRVNKDILERMTQDLKNDPVTYATQVGSHALPDINEEGGFAALGRTALSIASHYEIPVSEMKPLTTDMQNWVKGILDKGDANQSLQVLAGISSMGKDMSRAAMKQLEQKDPTFGYIGSLYLEGQTVLAADILRGTQKLKENPALEEQLGLKDTATLNDAMIEYTEGALFRTPALNQSVQDAARSYFVEVVSKGSKPVTKDLFKEAAAKVLGGTDGYKPIDEVNGSPTFIPRGTTAGTIEQAFKRISMADLVAMSDDGSTPRLADGTPIDIDDIDGRLNLQYLGGGKYSLFYDDGSPVIGDNAQRAFVMNLDVQRINRIARGAK